MWTLLKTLADWERYQQTVASGAGYAGTPIAWGSGPREYPCLVTTYQPPPRAGESPRLVSAYVYEADVWPLTRAAREAGRPAHPEAGGPQLPGQANFNRWLTAHTLVWAKIAREVCCVRADQFEGWLLEALELVDQARGEKRDQLLAGLGPGDKALLDRLDPPG